MTAEQKAINERIWDKFGHIGYRVGMCFDHCPISKESHRNANYCIEKWRCNLEECVSAIKKLPGVKYVHSYWDRIYFWYDDSAVVEEIRKEKEEAKQKRRAFLDSLHIEQWKPTTSVIKKLTDYFNRGSNVNVAAIKDVDKLMTYYYASVLLGWQDLKDLIWDKICFDFCYVTVDGIKLEEYEYAINQRVTTDPAIMVNHGDASATKLFDYGYKKIWLALKTAGIKYSFKSVSPTALECWKDMKNGCAYTCAYELETASGKKVRWSDVTNEGGGSFGYQLCPGNLIGKTDLEDRVLAILAI